MAHKENLSKYAFWNIAKSNGREVDICAHCGAPHACGTCTGCDLW